MLDSCSKCLTTSFPQQHKRPGDASVRGRSATLKVELGAGSAALTVAASKGTEWGSFGARVKLIAHSFPEIELSVVRAARGSASAISPTGTTYGGLVGPWKPQGQR